MKGDILTQKRKEKTQEILLFLLIPCFKESPGLLFLDKKKATVKEIHGENSEIHACKCCLKAEFLLEEGIKEKNISDFKVLST